LDPGDARLRVLRADPAGRQAPPAASLQDGSNSQLL